MKLEILKDHLDKDIYKKAKETSPDKFVSLLARKPKIYAALDKAVKEIRLTKISSDEAEQVDVIAKKIAEVAHFSKAKPMSKDYATEVPKQKIGEVKGHFHPGMKLKRTKMTINQLHEKWQKSKTKRPFAEWASDQVSSKDTKSLKAISVKYMDAKERKPFLVTFKDGKLVNDKIGKEATGKFIYVLSPDKELYVAEKEKGQLNHSSILAGQPVRCAGKMELKKGKVVWYNGYSGHYKPTSDMLDEMVKFMADKKHLGKDAKELVRR